MRAAAAVALLAAAGCAASAPEASSKPPPIPAAPEPPAPLRLSGELPAAPASAGPPGSIVSGRYRVCLDNGGHVKQVMPVEGIAGADDAVVTALHGWSWFVVFHDTPPTCFVTPVHLAVPRPSVITRQAGSSGVAATLLHAAAVAPPPWLASAYAGKLVEGVYKVCVGDDGMVQTVRPVAGVPGADDAFIAGLRASAWDLRVGTLAQAPFCFGAPVRLDQRHATANTAVPPPMPFPPELAHPERGLSIVVLMHKLAGNYPSLPDAQKVALLDKGSVFASYRQCIGADGSVATVEPLAGIAPADAAIMEQLRGWRYELRGPTGLGVCEAVALTYNVSSNGPPR